MFKVNLENLVGNLEFLGEFQYFTLVQNVSNCSKTIPETEKLGNCSSKPQVKG